MNAYLNKTLLVAAGIVAIFSTAGCAKKPPTCADPATVQTIQSILVDNAKAQWGADIDNSIGDPKGIQKSYYQALKSEIGAVVSDGYNEQAKKYTCRGDLSISTASGAVFARKIVYSTQLTESKDADFFVEVQEFMPFVNSVVLDVSQYFSQKRYKGDWVGTYSCAGIDDAQDGPQGPFTMPVTMVVNEKMEGILERTTKGGGFEKLSGSISPPRIRLSGEGKNSDDDTWRTEFEGAVVKGGDFTASGRIQTPSDNRILRKCTMTLKLPS